MITSLVLSCGMMNAGQMSIHQLHTLSNTMEHSEFLQMALAHDSLTRAITTQQWYDEIGISSDDTLSIQFTPTLYDLIADDYYSQRLPQRDSVREAWQAFHASDRLSLPSLYIRLNRNGYIPNDTLYALYEAAKNRWESGYILTRINDHRNKAFYTSLKEYQQRFPTSPFIPNIVHAQQQCEQIYIFYSHESHFRSTDSIVIDYGNTNAHEIIFELYRLPDKWRKKEQVGNAMKKVDSVRVSTDSALIFKQSGMVCKMAPQPYGRYYVYARLPEDTLQKPVSMLTVSKVESNAFFVSDLCFFSIKEEQFGKSRPILVFADINTGKPVQRVKVKYNHTTRWTNRKGEVSIRSHKNYRYHSFTMQKGADKYHKAKFYGGKVYDVSGKLLILPNASIFRPGDTLRLAFIGVEKQKYETKILKNADIKVRISSYQGYKMDTVLHLNDEGTTSFALPFTDDMKRGNYYIHAKNEKQNESGYCSVELEDYRLPTFSLAFDDSCRSMPLRHLQPITGKAVRTNGLPLSGLTVETNISCYVNGKYIGYEDTTLTDQNGCFRVQIPKRLQEHAQTKYIHSLKIFSSITTPDGDKQDATLFVLLSSEEKDTSAPSKAEPIRIAGVPKDSLIWAPKDSTLINGREVTMRVGVPRESWVYCIVSRREKLVSHSWRRLTPGMHTYSFTLPDTPDDYLDIRYVTIGPDGEPQNIFRHLEGVAPRQLHIIPTSMRDYLTPDAQEHWTFRLTNTQGQAVQGNMVLTMTDKALEKLNSSLWRDSVINRWKSPYTAFYKPSYYSTYMTAVSVLPAMKDGFRFYPPILYEPYRVDSNQLHLIRGIVVDAHGEPLIGVSIQEKGTTQGTVSDMDGRFSLAIQPNAILEFTYIGMRYLSLPAFNNMYVVLQEDEQALNEVVVTGYGKTTLENSGIYGARTSNIAIRGASIVYAEETIYGVETLGIVEEEDTSLSPANSAPVSLREGDTRLALFLPSLHTDSAGEVHVHFKTPSDNTEWLVQAFAWTQDATSDYLSRSLMARRTLMMRLLLPRFVRHGDEVHIPYTITNAADTARQTSVSITLRDAQTDTIIYSESTSVLLAAGASQTLFVDYNATRQADVIVAATVQDTNGTADGEKRLLRVLPLDEPVQESLPFYLHAYDTTLTLRLSVPEGAHNKEVQLLLCDDPIAYIASQLPEKIDSSAVTLTQTVHNLYALSLRNQLAKEYPAFIQPVDLEFLINELKKYQRISDGAFVWLKDHRSTASSYLTLRVITLLGELQQMNALDPRLNYTLERAVLYMDREITQREKAYRTAHHDSLPDYRGYAQYAYARVLSSEPQKEDTRRILLATLDALYAHLNTKELTTWPLLALTFERAGQHDRALALINGVRRYATMDDAHGMYWNNLPDRYWWYRQADVQASFLLAFSLIDPQANEIDAMRQWLILNNRTTRWGDSSLNAYVSYVLMQGLTPAQQPVSKEPLQVLVLPDTTTLYSLHHSTGRPAWGALMASYNAPANSIQAFATQAMKITRRYERIGAPALADSVLHKGERIRVTLTLTTDREMDQVIITDRRPAALEPVGSSEYVWREGTFYYREIRNTEERLYVEHLRRGETVISYECYVSFTGTTLAGLSTATSELAPEFTTHTASAQLHSAE